MNDEAGVDWNWSLAVFDHHGVGVASEAVVAFEDVDLVAAAEIVRCR
jgi:hypothetical protein